LREKKEKRKKGEFWWRRPNSKKMEKCFVRTQKAEEKTLSRRIEEKLGPISKQIQKTWSDLTKKGKNMVRCQQKREKNLSDLKKQKKMLVRFRRKWKKNCPISKKW